MKSIFQICEKNKCVGCTACFAKCPKKCIKMVDDIYGFKQPQINHTNCINCLSCVKVCPQINDCNFLTPIKCFAVKNKNLLRLSKSTSGAFAIEILIKIVEDGGTAYCTAFDKETTQFCIKRYDSGNLNDLIKEAPGSKYLQTNLNDCFTKMKKDLENNIVVCFISTPCHIAGLKKFLSKQYENLVLIDFVCHGVPSQKMFFDHLYFNKVDINNIEAFSFRRRGKYYLDVLGNNNKLLYSNNLLYDKYLEGFLSNISLRKSCFNCKYSKFERVGDITIGDFWGLQSDSKFSVEDGVTMVFVNNLKGSKFFNSISERIDYEERNLKEGVNYNSQLKFHSIPHKKSDLFYKIYPIKPFDYCIKKCRSLKTKIRYMPILNKIVERRYK